MPGKVIIAAEISSIASISFPNIIRNTFKKVSTPQLQKDLFEHITLEKIPKKYIDNITKIFINSTGRFVSGEAKADCGLTGCKTIVDIYGGWRCHIGGAFSGKDPSKVDRSGAHMARFIAKNRIDLDLAWEKIDYLYLEM